MKMRRQIIDFRQLKNIDSLSVIPAKAGIQSVIGAINLDSRLNRE